MISQPITQLLYMKDLQGEGPQAAIIPADLQASCIEHKGTVFVYAALQVTQGPVSMRQLAKHCGMPSGDVRRSLRWLEAAGWVRSFNSEAAEGKACTGFEVLLERGGALQA